MNALCLPGDLPSVRAPFEQRCSGTDRCQQSLAKGGSGPATEQCQAEGWHGYITLWEAQWEADQWARVGLGTPDERQAGKAGLRTLRRQHAHHEGVGEAGDRRKALVLMWVTGGPWCGS